MSNRPYQVDTSFLHTVAQIAINAGHCIMSHFSADVEHEKKADNSPVTAADREAEHIIATGLGELAPDIQIIGEEACAVHLPDSLDETFFLVDPLDGTFEFINGRQDFTVNIGLISQNQPVAGVIYAPARHELFISGADAAYFCTIAPNETLQASQLTPIQVRPTPSTDGLIVVASRSHRSPETETYLQNFNVTEFMSAGSSLKFCLVAKGQADLYPRHGRTMEWDTAAGHAILNSAGGEVIQLDGSPLTYGKLSRGLDNPYFIARARQK